MRKIPSMSTMTMNVIFLPLMAIATIIGKLLAIEITFLVTMRPMDQVTASTLVGIVIE